MLMTDIPLPNQANGREKIERPEDGETGKTQLDIAQGQDQEDDASQDELRDVLSKYGWTKDTKECIEFLVDKQTEYYEYVTATGKMALWRLCFEQWVKGLISLGSISRGGSEGELLNLPINEYRNIGMHVVRLATQEKLAFEPQPINSDYSTAAQVTLAKGICNDYVKNKGVQSRCNYEAEMAWVFGEASTLKLWNENIGDLKMVDESAQKIYRKGDVQMIGLNPTNLIRDIKVTNFGENQWFIARIFVNKYDLAALYPQKARAICDHTVSSDWDNTRITANQGEDTDFIPLYLAFHKPTPAVPFGRQIFYLDPECWLEDGHLKYRSLDDVIVTNMPSPIESINFGYTTAFDLLPIQQMIEILDTGGATNISNFLVTNILVPEGCNLGVADLIGQMALLKFNPQLGKPEPLNLVEYPEVAIQFRAMLVERMEIIAGVNATTRGQTDEKITSGTMAALYASQAIHFNSGFQQSYDDHASKLMTAIIHDLQDHPEDKRTGIVVGKGNRAYMKEFYGKDIVSIERITIQRGSAFAQTDAGKLQMAQDLMASPTGLDAHEYLEVVETGSLERLTEGPHRELMFIKEENERLMDGMPCVANIADDHVTHIKEHKSVLADPQLRMSNDPKAAQVVTNVLTHIAQHEQLMQQCIQTRPILAGILGFGGPPQTPAGKPPQKPAPHPAALPAGGRPATPMSEHRPAPAPVQRPTKPAKQKMPVAAGHPGAAPSIGIPQPQAGPQAPVMRA
jgi:hypothetical protein